MSFNAACLICYQFLCHTFQWHWLTMSFNSFKLLDLKLTIVRYYTVQPFIPEKFLKTICTCKIVKNTSFSSNEQMILYHDIWITGMLCVPTQPHFIFFYSTNQTFSVFRIVTGIRMHCDHIGNIIRAFQASLTVRRPFEALKKMHHTKKQHRENGMHVLFKLR